MKFNMFGQPEEEQYPFAPMDPVTAPSPMVLPTDQPSVPQQQEMNPVVKQYLQSKLQKPQEPVAPEVPVEPQQTEEFGGGFDWQSGIAGLGQAIAGRDPSRVIQQIKQQRLVDQEMQGDADPNSEKSKLMQAAAARLMPGKDFSKASAAQLRSVLPNLETLARLDADRLNRAESRAERLNLAKIAAGDRAIAREEKRAEKLEAEKKKIDEATYRKTQLDKSLDRLKQLVKSTGTNTLVGAEGSEMDSLIYQAAVDYAKLVDPDSVAREGEVAAAQKYMLPFRENFGLTTAEDTALEQIENYRRSLNERMQSRQEAKGAGVPGAQQPAQTQTKVINGKTYRKVPGGWEEVE